MDVEIDRREYNGHTIVFQEDKSKEMIKPDGTSMQYIISIEGKNQSLGHKRYITDLMKQLGYRNAYYGAKAIFANPEQFKHVMGDWLGFIPNKT